MAEHSATVTWHLAPRAEFTADNFNKDHEWTFPGGDVVPASSSPFYGGVATRVNPEEAVIAGLSSCHMLTFLALAAKQGLKVLSYVDSAVGVLGRNADGRMALTEITLRPRVVFGDHTAVEQADFEALHQKAHKHCFIGNSLNSTIHIEPQLPVFR